MSKYRAIARSAKVSAQMPSPRACLTSIALAVFAANAGCAGDKDAAYPDIQASELAEDYAQLVCGLLFECECRDPGYASVDLCVAARRMEFQFGVDAGEASGLSYDAACAGQIVGQVEDQVCGNETPLSSSCAYCKPFYGEVGVGEPCAEDDAANDNCQQGLLCSSGPDGLRCEDPCSSEAFLGEGRPCWDPMSSMLLGECDYRNGLYCDTTDTGNCASPGARGEPCPAGRCADGLVCDIADPDSPVCVTAPGLGEACPAFECSSGLSCDFADPADPICAEPQANVCFFAM